MDINSRYKKIHVKGLTFTQPSMAQQQFRDECDMNTIIARYNTTGLLTDPLHPGTRAPRFGDFSEIPDYKEAQNLIIQAGDLFNELPARIRKEFNNDPAELLRFCSDPLNYNRAIELGIILETPASDNNIKDNPAPKSEPIGEL